MDEAQSQGLKGPRLESILLNNKIPFPERMNRELMEQWSTQIPLYPENDPNNPEWPETPTRRLDLSRYGLGEALVKDESVNPTGTFKDRAAFEWATLYRDFARRLDTDIREGRLSFADLDAIPVPVLSNITGGSEGPALARRFEEHHLPPVRLLIGKDESPELVASLKKLRAEVYQTNLSARPLTRGEIKRLTNNARGADITSMIAFEPGAILYDWLFHEVANKRPTDVLAPYGSGRLIQNLGYWQGRTARASGARDPRLHADVRISDVAQMNIWAAEPAYPSIAKKLAVPHKPFSLWRNDDFEAMKAFLATGPKSGIYPVRDESIVEAFDFLRENKINTEPSAAAGLALLIEKKAEFSKKSRILIINTGKGKLPQ